MLFKNEAVRIMAAAGDYTIHDCHGIRIGAAESYVQAAEMLSGLLSDRENKEPIFTVRQGNKTILGGFLVPEIRKGEE